MPVTWTRKCARCSGHFLEPRHPLIRSSRTPHAFPGCARPAATLLDCGGKRSATPPLDGSEHSESGVVDPLCHRSPNTCYPCANYQDCNAGFVSGCLLPSSVARERHIHSSVACLVCFWPANGSAQNWPEPVGPWVCRIWPVIGRQNLFPASSGTAPAF